MSETKFFAGGVSRDGETQPCYRPDIDGLRAAAVSCVVLFHAGLGGFRGGFVGVDVFFVISGYLIGGIVHRDVERGRFSFATFYARRAKRILPALLALTLVQCALALVLLSPSELRNFAKSAATALVGVSNIRYWQNTDYFMPDAGFDPFLMTWSLGVEEQFYLILPPILLLIHSFAPRRLFALLCVASILSFALSIVFSTYRPSLGFYLLPTRAWELGLGTLLMLWQRERGPIVRPGVASGLGAAGLAAIAFAVVFFNSTTPFPGWAAIIPVAGSAALLAAEPGWLNRRLLASPPMRFVGLLSYSWYLWHWPLMAFARICYGAEPPVAVLSAIAAIALAIAYLSWRFIERPFRQAHRSKDKRLLLAYGASLGACLSLLAAIIVAQGLPQRLPPQATSVERTLAEGHGAPCIAGYGQTILNRGPLCVTPMTAPRVALLGDSHAAALGDALRIEAGEQGLGFTMFTKSSCPPLYRATRQMAANPQHAEECSRYNRRAIEAVITDPSIRTVVLAGFWSIAFEEERPGDGYVLANPSARWQGTSQALFHAALADTLLRLVDAGKQVIVLGDTPRFAVDPALTIYTRFLPARAAVQRVLAGSTTVRDGTSDRKLVVPTAGGSAQIVAETARDVPNVLYLSLTDALCTRIRCRTASDIGQLYYSDTQHLSKLGAGQAIKAAGLPALLGGWKKPTRGVLLKPGGA